MSGERAGCDSPPALCSIVGYLLRRAQQFHTANWTTVLAGQVTGPQYAVLDVLARRPDADRRAIAAIAALDATSTAEVIARLVHRGWVAREPDPRDGRRQRLSLTDGCEALLDELTAGARATEALLLHSLTRAQRTTLVRGLRRIARIDEVGELAGLPDDPRLLRFVDSPGHLVRRAQQIHTAIWGEELGGELTGPQYATMRVLQRGGPSSQREIGRLAALDRSSTADIVSRLTARGWLHSRPDPDDRRRRQVRLTGDGERVMGRIQSQVAQVQERLMTPVRPVSRAGVVAALTRIAFRGEVPADPW